MKARVRIVGDGPRLVLRAIEGLAEVPAVRGERVKVILPNGQPRLVKLYRLGNENYVDVADLLGLA